MQETWENKFSEKKLMQNSLTQKLNSLNCYLEILTESASFEEQLILFTTKSIPFFSNLTSNMFGGSSLESFEFIQVLSRFLNSIIFQYDFFLKVRNIIFSNLKFNNITDFFNIISRDKFNLFFIYLIISSKRSQLNH